MAALGIKPEDTLSVIVDERLGNPEPTWLKDGPVVSYLDMPIKKLPVSTRLFGRVWTAGEMVIVRYDEIQVPGGRRMPFCAEVDDSGGRVKKPESPPGVAIIQDNFAAVRVVTRYGENDSREGPMLYLYRNIEDLPPEPRGPRKQ